MKKLLTTFITSLLVISSLCFTTASAAESQLPAFPGAMGGGKFTKGARNTATPKVYIVNDLSDEEANGKAAKDRPGTLRYAMKQSNAYIVFEVGGVVNLTSELTIKGQNVTILGQTAPGDGITLARYDGRSFSGSNNLILRYMKFRTGAVIPNHYSDAFTLTKGVDVILDHLSAGWSSDETLSTYANTNFTLQNSIVSESLAMSGHDKGRHGYGGIWGGNNASYINNLMATHTSRNPRVEVGGGSGPSKMDLRNNVIYNWGFNSVYGGEAVELNLVNNYFKTGPGTAASVMDRIGNPGVADRHEPAAWYVNGNYFYGNEAVTSDNSKGIYPAGGDGTYTALTAPNGMTGTGADYITTQTAQEAYEKVIAQAGCTMPYRDAYDARVINDVINGTGKFINVEHEVGGYPSPTTVYRPANWDGDRDGIPDEWEVANNVPGHSTNVASHSVAIAPSGYSYLEEWANSLIPQDKDYTKENPNIELNIRYNQIFNITKPVEFIATASDSDGIEKVEFKAGSDNTKTTELFATATSAPYKATWTAQSDGTYYIIATAYDKKGNATQTTSKPIHVGSTKLDDNWKITDVGNVKVNGTGSYSSENSLAIIKGAGRIGGTNDSCSYLYKKISGDATIIAKMNYITPADNGAFGGLLFRESLDSDAKIYGSSVSYRKCADSGTITGGFVITRAQTAAATDISLTDENAAKDKDMPVPVWLKIVRTGDKFTSYQSDNGAAWTVLGNEISIPMEQDIYVGFAADGAYNGSQNAYVNSVRASNVSLTGKIANEIPTAKFSTSAPVPEKVTDANYNFAFTLADYEGDVTVSLNGTSVFSGKVAVNTQKQVALSFAKGLNTIKVTVVANGVTKNYTYIVTCTKNATPPEYVKEAKAKINKNTVEFIVTDNQNINETVLITILNMANGNVAYLNQAKINNQGIYTFTTKLDNGTYVGQAAIKGNIIPITEFVVNYTQNNSDKDDTSSDNGSTDNTSGRIGGGTSSPVNLNEALLGITNAAKGTVTVVNMSTNQPAVLTSLFEDIKGKDVTVALDFGSFIWSYNGKDVKDIPADRIFYNMGVQTISDKSISALAGENEVMQLELAHNGLFPCPMNLTFFAGNDYIGKTVYLNYFNETTKQLEVISNANVGVNGNATFTITHASKYVVTKESVAGAVISEKQKTSVKKNLNTGSTKTSLQAQTIIENPSVPTIIQTPSTASDNINVINTIFKTDGKNMMLFIVISMFVLSLSIGGWLYYKKVFKH